MQEMTDLRDPVRCIAVTESRADWPERAMLAGFKNHAGSHPCNDCLAPMKRLHTQYDKVSLTSLPWPIRSSATYLEELERHLVPIDLESADDRDALIANMHFVRARPWGRRIQRQFRHLKPGDKLISSGTMLTVHDLDRIACPCRVHFFRDLMVTGMVDVAKIWHVAEVFT